MKLNDTLIATLPDFARHFTIEGFWRSRHHFVRDMHPARVWYVDPAQRDAYYVVARWIESAHQLQPETLAEGVGALSVLVGRQVDEAEVKAVIAGASGFDLSRPIISVRSRATVVTVEAMPDSDGERRLRLHKLEYDNGRSDYALSADGVITQVLAGSARNANYDVRLVSDRGKFASTLVVNHLPSDTTTRIDGVTSFALLDDGLLYTDAAGHLVVPARYGVMQVLLNHDEAAALFVTGCGSHAAVLYADGVMRSTLSMEPRSSVWHVAFDDDTLRVN